MAFSGPNGWILTHLPCPMFIRSFRRGLVRRKGIYDVDIFEQARTGAFRDAVLSTIARRVFARAALASDIEMVEEFPLATMWSLRGNTLVRAIGNCCHGSRNWPSRAGTSGSTVIPALGRWKCWTSATLLSAPRCSGVPGCWQLPLTVACLTTFLALTIACRLVADCCGDCTRHKGFSWRSHVAILPTIQFWLQRKFFSTWHFLRVSLLALDAILRTMFVCS